MMNKKKINLYFHNPFFILFLSSFILHLFIRTNFGDDTNYFEPVLEKYEFMEFLTMRYECWSSRVIIEGILVFLVRVPLVWKVLDSLVLVLLAWSVSYLAGCRKNITMNWFVACVTLIYPIHYMSSAGWMATTLNYLWVAAFMFFAFTGVYRVFCQKRISTIHKIALIPATIYAANQEQACVCMCLLFAAFLGWLLVSKEMYPKGKSIIFIQWIISVGSLSFILLSPGNANRSKAELFVSLRSVEHGRYSILDKLALGFQNSMMTMFSSKDVILLTFLLILVVAVYLKWKGSLGALSLFFVPFIIKFLHLLEINVFSKTTATTESLLLLNNDTYMRKHPYIIIVFWAVILWIMVLSVLIISKNVWEFLYMLLILGAGLGSSMVMGFSPTYDYSGERTFIFFYFALIYMGVYIIKNHWDILRIQNFKYSRQIYRICGLVLGVVTFMSVIDQWIYVCLQ